MMMLWLSGSCAMFMLIVLFHAYTRRSASKTFRAIGERYAQGNAPVRRLLFLKYSDEAYRELDPLLAETPPQSAVVFFEGPEWLVNVQRKKWSHHTVVPCSQLPQSLSGSVVELRTRKATVFSETVGYMHKWINSAPGSPSEAGRRL